MKAICGLMLCCAILLSTCGPNAEQQAVMTHQAMTETAAAWTSTPSPTWTFTPAPTFTPTISPTPTRSPTPTISPTPEHMISSSNCAKVQEIQRIGSGAFNMLVYSADGSHIAAATTTGVAVYDAVSLSAKWTARTDASVEQIAFRKDGETLVGVDTYAQIYTWQTSDGAQLLSKSPDDINELPTGFALSPDGLMLAVPYYDDSIRMYRTSDAGLEYKIEQWLSLGEMIHLIAYSPDGQRLVTTSFNGEIRVWDIPGRRLLRVLDSDETHYPTQLTFTPDGRMLAVGFGSKSGEKITRILDVYSIAWQHTVDGEMIAFSPDKSMLSMTPAGIHLHEYYNGIVLKTLPESNSVQGTPAFSPDGSLLAVGTQTGVDVWRWSDATLSANLPGQYPNYTGLAVSPDGLLLAAGAKGRIDIHQIEDGAFVQSLTTAEGSDPVTVVAYSPLGDLVAGASASTVYVWFVSDGNLWWSFDTGKTVNQLAFSPDGELLAAALSEGTFADFEKKVKLTIPVWGAYDGLLVKELGGSDRLLMPGYTSIAFSTAGHHLVAAQGNGDIELWELVGYSKKYTLSSEGFFGWDIKLAFSPDGQQFASGGMDRQITLWKVGVRQAAKTIPVEDNTIEVLSYSPDGKLIASGVSNEIRLWGTNMGTLICTIKGSSGTLHHIYFTPDGRKLVTQAEDGVIRIWAAP